MSAADTPTSSPSANVGAWSTRANFDGGSPPSVAASTGSDFCQNSDF